jgi:hypothetical protein
MKTALLTANYNRILCDNSRNSFQAAAERWNADYIELTEITHPITLHPASTKMQAFQVTDADAVFIIDADAIISAKCPNPFTTFEPTFMAVGLSRRIDPDGHLAWLGNTHEWRDKLNVLPGVEPIDPGDWKYFNSGVMLAWREACEAAFTEAFRICNIPNQMGWIEQTPIQYGLKKFNVPVQYGGEEWNYIHGYTLGIDWWDMKTHNMWIIHFAGDPARLQWLPIMRWR